VSLAIATAVAQVVYDRGLAGAPKPENLRSWLKAQTYEPKYWDYGQETHGMGASERGVLVLDGG
jgi:hypothetical protein